MGSVAYFVFELLRISSVLNFSVYIFHQIHVKKKLNNWKPDLGIWPVGVQNIFYRISRERRPISKRAFFFFRYISASNSYHSVKWNRKPGLHPGAEYIWRISIHMRLSRVCSGTTTRSIKWTTLCCLRLSLASIRYMVCSTFISYISGKPTGTIWCVFSPRPACNTLDAKITRVMFNISHVARVKFISTLTSQYCPC